MSTSSGPFHAFRCERTTVKSTLSPTSSPNLPGLELWRLLSDNLDDALNEEDIITAPWSTELCFPDELLEINQQPEADPPLQLSQQEQYLPESSISGTLFTLGPSVISPPDLEDFEISTAKLLLDHYQNITTTLYTPASVESKTPWEVCYVPTVLSTLGEIALNGNSSDAKVSLLFAVLAISAFRLDILGSPSRAKDWRTLGTMYRQRATKRLQLALRHLSAGLPKKEKYKNILMPLLSMVTICVRTNSKTCIGSQTDTAEPDC